MIKDEAARRSIPEKLNRELVLGRVLLTLVFTAVQVWAASRLADLGLSGWQLCSLVVVLAAAIIAALDAWKEIWMLFRRTIRHSSKDCGEEAERWGEK